MEGHGEAGDEMSPVPLSGWTLADGGSYDKAVPPFL